MDAKALTEENLPALERGIANLERHLHNVRNHYGLPCVIALNHFTADTDAEVSLLQHKMAHHGAKVIVARHWAEGGAGAEDLARAVVRLAESGAADCRFLYKDDEPLLQKMKAVATRIYGAVRHQRRHHGAGADPQAARTKAMAGCRCAWPRPKCRFPPTRNCAARPRTTWSTSARSGFPPAPSSW